jgi:hypothetical protein
MATYRNLNFLTFSVAVAVLAATAHADVLYESYDPTSISVTFPTVLTAFSDSGGQNIYGAEFSPTESGILDSLTAPIAVDDLVQPGFPAVYQFNLFLQPIPGAMVDPFNDTPIDTFSQSVNTPTGMITTITFSSTDHPFLSSANTYWLYMGTSPGEAQPLQWGVPSTTGVTGQLDDASSPLGGTMHVVTTTTLPAFVLNGNMNSNGGGTLPEPDYVIPAGIGFALLVAFRLISRRNSEAN